MVIKPFLVYFQIWLLGCYATITLLLKGHTTKAKNRKTCGHTSLLTLQCQPPTSLLGLKEEYDQKILAMILYGSHEHIS